MDRATAKAIAVAALRSAAEINNLVPLLKATCPEPEYEAWRDRIAEASMLVTQGLLPAVFAEHADLEAELDDHYQRFGRPA
ncbi:hypothetical protein [Candidatus Viadribacter manganicus]|uniref:Uncharacterized protein n=1 Tax=Candidatus Viadribacter manganicus TaxID=1759059 RepID=A0A1B1AMI7_9PROT|nr:hypothetical protein [Candidatus Viadribacter manganicus]ANP47787.1 hypothetical protein ATE48_18730 [Candidatus Viadribacter manganicus]